VAIQPVSSLKEFFRDALHDALSHQHVAVEGETEHYVVNVLTMFSDADALYDRDPRTPDSRSRLKPLAIMLGEALEAPTSEARFRGLQRLGDVSLFIAGFFSAGFARKLVDVDYHIAMGGQAYGALAESCPTTRARTLRQVFAELAAKFQPMVDALNEISESSYQHSDQDRLRLYELWLKTGSERSRQLLRKLGVEPAPAARTALVN
jgi:DNA-binding PucR family transcriptional regulator